MVYVVMTCELMLYVLMAYVNEYGLYTYGQYSIAMATHIIAGRMHACAHARMHARVRTHARTQLLDVNRRDVHSV